MEISVTRTFTKDDGCWRVLRGGSRHFTHRLVFDPPTYSCTCKEYERTKPRLCRHLYGLKFYLRDRGELPKKGRQSPAKETPYRDWPSIYKGMGEKYGEIKRFLFELCRPLQGHMPSELGGRPRVPLSDLVYATVLKVRMQEAQRNMKSVLRDEKEAGRLTVVPTGSCIGRFFWSPEAEPTIRVLLDQTLVPLAGMDTTFAVDSTALPIPRRELWFDSKAGEPRERMQTMKAHGCCGINTHIIAGVQVTQGDRNLGKAKKTGDSRQFPFLLSETCKRFRVLEVLGDNAYCSNKNYRIASDAGIRLTSYCKKSDEGLQGGPFRLAVLFQRFHPREHQRLYGRRSHIESVNSVIKRLFPGKLFCKEIQSLRIEILCMILIHNLGCLVRAKHEWGKEIEFWKGDDEEDETV
ncbi:MAG: transposase [Pirellulaceae bacterium]|nr:transposase [Pirellulaceae bacterium]